jgi:hypothetical protein
LAEGQSPDGGDELVGVERAIVQERPGEGFEPLAPALVEIFPVDAGEPGGGFPDDQKDPRAGEVERQVLNASDPLPAIIGSQ